MYALHNFMSKVAISFLEKPLYAKKVWILNVFLFHYFLIKSQLSDYIHFTFMHMADTFIQSDVHCIQGLLFPWIWTHDLGVSTTMLKTTVLATGRHLLRNSNNKCLFNAAWQITVATFRMAERSISEPIISFTLLLVVLPKKKHEWTWKGTGC